MANELLKDKDVKVSKAAIHFISKLMNLDIL